MEFYDRMKAVRIDADATQQKVADVLEITRQQYQLYESGKRSLPIDLLAKFCAHYGVSADYLLGLAPGLSWPRK